MTLHAEIGGDESEQSLIHPTTAQTDSHDVWRAWYALIVFELQILAAGIDLGIVTLLVHPIETALHLNDVGFAAVTATPAAIGLAASFYPAGLLADTFCRRNMVAIGVLIWGLAALVAARTDSGTMLFLARLLAGIGTGVPMPAIFSMITDAFPRRHRPKALGSYFSGISLGAGIGLAICGALVAGTQRVGMLHLGGVLVSPWQQCFVAVAVSSLVIFALTLTVHEPQRLERAISATSGPTSFTSSLRILGQYLQRHWLLWSLLLLGGTLGLTSWSSSAWVPAFGMRHYGSTGAASIALLGTFTAGGALLGAIAGGVLAQRFIDHGNSHLLPRTLSVLSACTCIFAVMFPYMPSWLLAVVGFGAMNATLNAMCLLIPVGIQETASNEVRGQLYGLWGLIVYIPAIIAPATVAFLASGAFAKIGDLGTAMAVVGGVTSVVSALLFALSGGLYERARHELRATLPLIGEELFTVV